MCLCRINILFSLHFISLHFTETENVPTGAAEPYNFVSSHMFLRFAVVKLTKCSFLHLQMLLSCEILPQADVPVRALR